MADKTPGTGPQTAPVTEPNYIQARHLTIERQGQNSAPLVEHFPQVRGGVCDFCGILDHNVPSEHQYKLCPHYRGTQLRCTYCDETKNPDEVNGKSVLNITRHPDFPNKLVICCDSFKCLQKHQERFKTASA